MLRGFRGEETGYGYYLVISSDDTGLDGFLERRSEFERMNGRVPAAHELLSDTRLRGFGDVFLFDDRSHLEIDLLIGELQVGIVSRVRALEAHREMREPQTDPDDCRPLREVLGLQDRDPWASPNTIKIKQRAQDVTQDSFSGPEPEIEPDEDVVPFTFEVSDVREVVRVAKLFRVPIISQGQSSVVVDAAYAGNLTEALERRRIVFQTAEEAPEPAPVDVLAHRPFRAFYRLDVTGLTLEAALVILADAGIDTDKSLLGWGENQDGIWLANAIERLAERHRDILVGEADGIETAIYRADTNGQRLEGTITAVVKEIGPRPWKDSERWAALTEAQRQSEIKSIEASEFLFTESQSGQTALFFFVPAEFYSPARGMWGGDLHPYINRFLPSGLKVSEPGVYGTTNPNIDRIALQLCRVGFRESLDFRNWLNDQ